MKAKTKTKRYMKVNQCTMKSQARSNLHYIYNPKAVWRARTKPLGKVSGPYKRNTAAGTELVSNSPIHKYEGVSTQDLDLSLGPEVLRCPEQEADPFRMVPFFLPSRPL